MSELQTIQQRIYQNKIHQQFNTSDINAEFINIIKELTEAIEAYENDLPSFGEELADIIIFAIGIAAIANIDIEYELMNKLDINEKRTYILKHGRRVKQQ